MSEYDDDLHVGDPQAPDAPRNQYMRTLIGRRIPQDSSNPPYSELLQAAKGGLDLWISTRYAVDGSTWFERHDRTPHREFDQLSKQQILLELHRERLCGVVAGARGKKLTGGEKNEALEAAADLINTWQAETLPQHYEVPGHHEKHINGMLADIEAAVVTAMKSNGRSTRSH